jgi:Flp pilus assembly protein TadD
MKLTMRILTIASLTMMILSGCTSKKSLNSQHPEDLLIPQVRSISGDAALRHPQGPQPAKPLPEMTAEDFERAGDAYFNSRNLHMAFIQYEKALRLLPDNPRVQYKRGLLLVAAKMDDEAIQGFKTVLEKEPGNALAYEGLGEAFFQSKNYPEAEQHLQRAIVLDPKLWKSHNILGVIHDYQGRHDMAIREYQAALALRPENGDLYNNLGMSYYLAGKYEDAVKAFYQALDAKNAQSKVYNNLGLALFKMGKHPEALEALRKGGNEAQAYNNLGCMYMGHGDHSKAARSFEKAIELKPAYYTTAGENLKNSRLSHSLPSDSYVTITPDQTGDLPEMKTP